MALEFVKQLTVFPPMAAYARLPLLLHSVYRNIEDITLNFSPSDSIS
jgi:hypothetical protein